MKTSNLFNAVFIIVLMVSSLSCKKAIEEQYDDILKKLMTDGSWIVTKFTEDGSDVTANFNGWICKFYDNNTMTATQGTGASTIVQSGNWQSNLTAQTIFAQFSSSVGDPLAKINGTWKITDSAPTTGKFSQNKNGINYTMELTKY